jgi:hypothetical protein
LVLLPDGERAIFKAFAEVRDSPGVCGLGIPDIGIVSVARGDRCCAAPAEPSACCDLKPPPREESQQVRRNDDDQQ